MIQLNQHFSFDVRFIPNRQMKRFNREVRKNEIHEQSVVQPWAWIISGFRLKMDNVLIGSITECPRKQTPPWVTDPQGDILTNKRLQKLFHHSPTFGRMRPKEVYRFKGDLLCWAVRKSTTYLRIMYNMHLRHITKAKKEAKISLTGVDVWVSLWSMERPGHILNLWRSSMDHASC